MSNQTIIVVEHPYSSGDGGDYYNFGDYLVPTIKTFPDIDSLLKDPNFLSELKSHGFINKKDTISISEFKLNDRLFFCDTTARNYGGGSYLIEITDKDDLQRNVLHNSSNLNKIAKGNGCFLKGVDIKDILSEEDLNRVEKEKKEIKKRDLASKKALETKKANKRAKEIEKARKILEESGEALPLTYLESKKKIGSK